MLSQLGTPLNVGIWKSFLPIGLVHALKHNSMADIDIDIFI